MGRKYRVVWSIELEKEFEVDSADKALAEAESLDCQHDGEYIVDSFEIIKIELKGGGGK